VPFDSRRFLETILEKMERECLEAVDAIVQSGGFATADAVMAVLGGVYRVYGHGGSLPQVVVHLCDLQRHLDAFVETYFFTKAVVLVHKMEVEAVQMLKRQGLRTMRDLKRTIENPDEILIDEEEESGGNMESFEIFGVGRFERHPLVMVQFPLYDPGLKGPTWQQLMEFVDSFDGMPQDLQELFRNRFANAPEFLGVKFINENLKTLKTQIFEASMPHLRSRTSINWIEIDALRDCFPKQALDTGSTDAVGRWGEELVYNFLKKSMNGCIVDWKNADGESRSSFDFHVTDKTTNSLKTSRFIEVKSTRYDNKNAFEISLNEWDFFTGRGAGSINFDIYRVFNAGDARKVRIAVIQNPLRLLKEQRIHLCIAI